MDHARLSFPLNAYACAVTLEEGELHSLHYGFDPGDDNILAAQRRASEFLLGRLPPPPARLLEVGVGLCATGRELLARGYDYTGVTPDATQVQTCAAAGLRVVHAYFERLPPAEPRYDLILFQESAQYIHPRALLVQAARLLRPGGRVIIADEVDTRILDQARHLLGDAGFELLREEDVTDRAAPTLDYLIGILLKHREAVMERIAVDGIRYSRLITSLETRRQAYHDGHYRYLFLEFQRL
ncbi:class I SAM-dependent methyltransferase [Endothiovibrio diazotrophicus]